MIQDSLLEYNPQWTAIANEGIGGPVPYVAPKVFTATLATPATPYLVVTNQGVGYVDMMAATHRPLMPVFFPNQVYYDFVFDLVMDPNALTQGQVLESEVSYCWQDTAGASWYCNNSLQVNIEAGWMVQAFTPSDVWKDTGIVLPKFVPNATTPVKISYLIDMQNKVYSTLAITVNGVRYPLPTAFQKIAATQRPGWAAGVYVQFQIGLASKGGSITNKYGNISVNWL
jgi:hypothetical protein